MSAQEFDAILSFVEELESDLTTVATINARHSSAFELTKDYLEVASQHENAGFCFVAGNRSYLTEEDRKLDPQPRIKELVGSSRTMLPSAKIFVGTEGLFELAFQLGIKYATIPFALLGDSGEHQISNLPKRSVDTGIYCPCIFSSQPAERLVKSFGHYALRRKWVRDVMRVKGLSASDAVAQISNGGYLEPNATQSLADAIRELVLCDQGHIDDKLRRFSEIGVRYVAILPSHEGDMENEQLAKMVNNFSDD
jgi:hypothetical protein